MKNIIIFGTGAVASELEMSLTTCNWLSANDARLKGFLASDEAGIEHWKEYKYEQPWLGLFQDYKIEKDDYFVLGLGSPESKRRVVEQIRSRGGQFISFIHPGAAIAKTAKIGEGCLIYDQTIVGANTVLGDFNLMTTQSLISHDCHIGSFNFFSTCLLCGYTHVGDDNYFGVRVTTMPSINIGSRTKIHAGMIVDKDVPDDSTLFYKYKEKILAIPKIED